MATAYIGNVMGAQTNYINLWNGTTSITTTFSTAPGTDSNYPYTLKNSTAPDAAGFSEYQFAIDEYPTKITFAKNETYGDLYSYSGRNAVIVYLTDSTNSNKIEIARKRLDDADETSGDEWFDLPSYQITSDMSWLAGKKPALRKEYWSGNEGYTSGAGFAFHGSVKATFDTTYAARTVQLSVGSNGTAYFDPEPSDSSKLDMIRGDSYGITVVPNTGYHVKSVTSTNNGTIPFSSTENKYIYTMKTPAAADTVTIEFEKTVYSITISSSNDGGDATIVQGNIWVTSSTATYEDTVNLRLVPNVGYELASLSKDPASLTITDNISFTMPASDVILTATWKQIDYSITVKSSTGGTAAADKLTAHYGDEVNISATPDYGYHFVKWITTDSITLDQADTSSDNSFTVNTQNVLVVANFQINTYTITWKNYDGNTIYSDTVTHGTQPEYDDETYGIPTRSQDNEYIYHFAGWDHEVVEATGDAVYTATFTTTNVSYTVTTEVDPENTGTITHPTNGQEIQWGTVVDATQTPAEGYAFLEWELSNGDQVDTNNQFTMPVQNVTLTAKYKLIHKLIWGNASVTYTQEDYQIIFTLTGSAIDNYQYDVEYLLFVNGVQAAVFSKNQAAITIHDSDVGIPFSCEVVARNTSNSPDICVAENGPTVTMIPKQVHKTVGYYVNGQWVECIPYYYTENEWIEVEFYYHTGDEWQLISLQ